MGRTFTRKAPGIRARAIAPIAPSDAERNSSLSDSSFTPYATDKPKDPVRLPRQKACGKPETVRG